MTVLSSISSHSLLSRPQSTVRKDLEPQHLATALKLKQQQELIQTAQQAFNETAEEQPNLFIPTGEIAKEAAVKHTKQTLVFAAVEAIKESDQRPIHNRPRIQTQA